MAANCQASSCVFSLTPFRHLPLPSSSSVVALMSPHSSPSPLPPPTSRAPHNFRSSHALVAPICTSALLQRRNGGSLQPWRRKGVGQGLLGLGAKPWLDRRRKKAANPRQSEGRGAVKVSALGQGPELGNALEVINNLGLDALTFLVATVLVIPAFKALKASPILGFLLSGVVLSQFGLIRNVTDVKALSELGILFLLFEMGLELSLARLKALAKFAFGIGLPQVVLTTFAFFLFEIPPGDALGTRLLEFFFNSRPDLINTRSIDEAVVIGAALSLSSSAFVLQLLAERGELPTRFGSATLGILLLQDIVVVPLLVILPILETGDFTDNTMFPLLAAAGLKALLGLGLLLLAGRLLLRRFFEVVAESRSPEAFVALCLLTVTGTALLTEKLGFSDSLGAFLAGALLAETNYRTQVEADIRPFRGLLLGLFFVTTGTSIDFALLVKEWPNILALLGGLIAIKTAIITALGPRAGLPLSESIRIGLLLSQGGEFAFVVFSLANQLGVLPIDLSRLLIIVVVLSMALTPLLDSVGRRIAKSLEAFEDGGNREEKSTTESLGAHNFEAAEPVVIIGFGQMAQVLANFLSTPLASGDGGDAAGWPYISFDLDPRRVEAARKLGFPVLYGDGSRAAVLQTAGISRPKAMMVMYTNKEKSVQSVERLRQAWPGVPIYARAQNLNHLLELKTAGATDVVLENAEASLRLGSILLQDLGVMRDDVVFLRRIMREAMDQRAREAYVNRNTDLQLVEPYQAKVRNLLKTRLKDGENRMRFSDVSSSSEDEEDPVGSVLRFEEDPLYPKVGDVRQSPSSVGENGAASHAGEVNRSSSQGGEAISERNGAGMASRQGGGRPKSNLQQRTKGRQASLGTAAAAGAVVLANSGDSNLSDGLRAGGAESSSQIGRAAEVEGEDYDGSLEYMTDDEETVDMLIPCEGSSCVVPEYD